MMPVRGGPIDPPWCEDVREDTVLDEAKVDKWAAIEELHYSECPVSIAAGKRLMSTCCLCLEIEEADRAARLEIKRED